MLTTHQKIRIAQPIVCIALVHAAALWERPVFAVASIAVVAAAGFAANLLGRGPRIERAVWLITALAMLLVILISTNGWPEAAAIIVLPPVLINLYFLYLFGSTLLPGREPLITRFSRLNLDGRIPAPLLLYTRRLTVVWAVLFTVLAVESAVLGAYAGLEMWSWFVNIINPLVALALFVLEHVYRTYRYGRFGPFSVVRTVRVIFRPDAWIPTKC